MKLLIKRFANFHKPDGRGDVFIVAMPRGGSTWLGELVSCQPGYRMIDEPLAMRKAVMDLKQSPDIILVDGNYPIPNVEQPQFAVIGGDRQCQSISAASVVAKITRDRIMDKYEALFPSFSFSQHKGYPTREHLDELREYGPTEIHRKSFKPVAELISNYALF